jgi:hypothetical protein
MSDKFAIYSHNVVLFSDSTPVPAIVLVQGENIVFVEKLVASETLEIVAKKYHGYRVIDCTNL